ncbi:multiple epidermal growth factor-like domains protein 6 isoform X1 [Mya arenaria]|uniref:multiple epidermal growth factor-like domains protein 6 isoform X1 n=1 Tax=Mya arenaria TaxID=6604 RepID=UPI0022E621F3|nr:multiple epidermal growth factor-like domains protein 6 isoform X1 [Mya arenaria]XP_052787491.1 multiple epidermal growth factor-like domains protein 6 isoform X1 [Mya arenaria]
MEICHLVVILCLIFVQAQIVLAQECSTCQCCAVGQHAPCTIEGYCQNGCIDGYYGENCINKCITPNCKSCYQSIGSYSCSECKSGYYLKNNICYNCGSQCKSCATYSCLSCNDGYWGDTCENNCNESCASCQKLNGFCLTCDPGYYVYNGKCNTCGTHCAVCGATRCSSCYDGYWGDTCENSCNESCASCQKWDGYCLACDPGYYVYIGKCNTCGTHCAVCGATRCSSCYDGYWGDTCENSCNESCASCQKWNGYCLTCDPGYYVYIGKCNTCDTHCAVCGATWCSSCRVGYWGNKCENSCTGRCASCQQSNGGCLSCKPGYMGSTCDERCVEYCLECDRLDGNCISCDKSHWGYACDACNVQCKICNQSNGCLECNVGYYGQTCDKDCGVYCQNCDRINGCLQCLPGYYKHNNMCAECSYRSNGCTCTSKVQCSGCVDGYFLNPSLCSKCPEYCSNCNKSSLSGQTVCTSCTAGTFGETCQYICSQDCENGYCDEKDPDETCSQCANGRFGEKCEHFCSLGCESRNCTKETGSCTCKTGWNGQRCQTFIQTKPEKQTTPTALGGVIGGGIVALSATVFLALFLFRRRKVNLSNKSKTNEKEPENLSALYEILNDRTLCYHHRKPQLPESTTEQVRQGNSAYFYR